jgi:small conductance mechanosensitive channel
MSKTIYETINKIIKYSLIFLLSCIFSIGFSPKVTASIPFLPASSGPTAQLPETPFWDVNKARNCGRFLCSNVFFYADTLQNEEVITLAVARDGRPIREVSLEVEQRAKLVQYIFQQIFQNISNSGQIGQLTEVKDWRFWVIHRHDHPIHPLTPIVDVGYENNQSVIFIASKPDLGLTQQTILTVTGVDARANNTTVEDLAQQWRQQVIRALSEAIWGLEMDKQQPFLRLQISLLSILLASFFIYLIRLFQKFVLKRRKNILSSLKDLENSLIVDPQVAVNNNSVNNNDHQPTILKENNSLTLSKNKNTFPQMISQSIDESIKLINETVSLSAKLLPKSIRKKQNILRQQVNFMELMINLSFVSQFTIVLFLIGSILFTYRQTRFLFSLFFLQALLVPIIWIFITLLNKFLDFWIEYSLHQWAQEQQDLYPDSNRPTLRINTYSPALRGASAFLFTVLGIFIYLFFIGIDQNFFASAGVFAVVFAFLSRNLLEDMLNGVLIFITDRYAVGDVVSINGVKGFVEKMNLYTTCLRDLDGNLTIIPNSKINTVTNMTKDWSRVNFTIEVSWDNDLTSVMAILKNIGEKMYEEPQWREKMLSPAEILGVDHINHEGILIRLLIRTKPIQQWDVGREYRWRVKEAFNLAGIKIGVPQREIFYRSVDSSS